MSKKRVYPEMSALGQKQTSRHVRVMFVMPLKGDIHQRGLLVRLVPKPDITGAFNGFRRRQRLDLRCDKFACSIPAIAR